jgi:hypothetical protein
MDHWPSILCIAMLTSCVSGPAADVPPEVLDQAARVEVLLARHGFTCAGHAEDVPVEGIQLLDGVFTKEEIVEMRRCSFADHASGFMVEPSGAIVLLFRDENHRRYGYAHLAGLREDGGFWANESYTSIKDPQFTKLPSNNAFKRRRAKTHAP